MFKFTMLLGFALHNLNIQASTYYMLNTKLGHS